MSMYIKKRLSTDCLRSLFPVVAALLLWAFGSESLQAQDILIRGARVYTMTDRGVLDPGDVLILSGKIAEVGQSISAPTDVRIIDGHGRYLMPGLMELHAHLATQDERGGGSDRHEYGQRVNTGLRILDSVNPQYRWLQAALEGGITTALITPGSVAPFGGQQVIIKTVPKPTVEEMLIKSPSSMKMAISATSSRGTSEMREWFVKGQEYLETWKRWEAGGKQGPAPKRNLQLEGIAKQLSGELPTHMHASTALHMQYALKMQREFGLEVVIIHGFDAWKMIDDLKKAGSKVSVCFGPITSGHADDSFFTPALLVQEGIKVALQMDSASDFQKHMLHAAQICVRFGMDPMEALKAMTINPAEMGHVDDRVGSLATGKDGDVIILDGDPMSTFSHVLYTIVEGEIVYDRSTGDSKPSVDGWP